MAAVAWPDGHELPPGEALDEGRAMHGQQRLQQLRGDVGTQKDRADRRGEHEPAPEQRDQDGHGAEVDVRLGITETGDEDGRRADPGPLAETREPPVAAPVVS